LGKELGTLGDDGFVDENFEPVVGWSNKDFDEWRSDESEESCQLLALWL
jgi:hypothetical protein